MIHNKNEGSGNESVSEVNIQEIGNISKDKSEQSENECENEVDLSEGEFLTLKYNRELNPL